MHAYGMASAAGATVQMGGRRSKILGPVAAAPLGMHRRRGELPSFPASDAVTYSVVAAVNLRRHGGLQP